MWQYTIITGNIKNIGGFDSKAKANLKFKAYTAIEVNPQNGHLNPVISRNIHGIDFPVRQIKQ
jgi:hypothetical protein